MRAFIRGTASGEPSSSGETKKASSSGLVPIFLRPPICQHAPFSLQAATTTSTLLFWESSVLPALIRWGIDPRGLRLVCRGRTVPIDEHTTLADLGVGPLSTIDVMARMRSQGFAQLHQLMEHLLDMLAPCGPSTTSPSTTDESSSLREPIMHAIDAEIKRRSSCSDATRCCSCLSCTLQPNSTLWLCGALLHSTDAAVVNITFRVLQLLLHARTNCPAPLVYFDEESGALTLSAREAEFGSIFEAVQVALTPEGVAIASLLSQRLVRQRFASPRAKGVAILESNLEAVEV